MGVRTDKVDYIVASLLKTLKNKVNGFPSNNLNNCCVTNLFRKSISNKTSFNAAI